MKLTRFLKPAQVRLELRTRVPEEIPEGWSRRRLEEWLRQEVLKELVELFEATGRVGNSKKLFTDLLNRERKASTALGGGLAVPHVRTMQAKAFAIVFARSTPGVPFFAPDGEPVHVFLGVISPPYEDRLYLQLYQKIGVAFRHEGKRKLMEAKDEHEVIRILSDVQGWESFEAGKPG